MLLINGQTDLSSKARGLVLLGVFIHPSINAMCDNEGTATQLPIKITGGKDLGQSPTPSAQFEIMYNWHLYFCALI